MNSIWANNFSWFHPSQNLFNFIFSIFVHKTKVYILILSSKVTQFLGKITIEQSVKLILYLFLNFFSWTKTFRSTNLTHFKIYKYLVFLSFTQVISCISVSASFDIYSLSLIHKTSCLNLLGLFSFFFFAKTVWQGLQLLTHNSWYIFHYKVS